MGRVVCWHNRLTFGVQRICRGVWRATSGVWRRISEMRFNAVSFMHTAPEKHDNCDCGGFCSDDNVEMPTEMLNSNECARETLKAFDESNLPSARIRQRASKVDVADADLLHDSKFRNFTSSECQSPLPPSLEAIKLRDQTLLKHNRRCLAPRTRVP